MLCKSDKPSIIIIIIIIHHHQLIRSINLHLLASDQVAATKHSSKAGVATWDKPELADAFKDIGPGTQWAMGKDEYMTVKAHKDKYSTAMRAQKAAADKRSLHRKVDENDVNLGMNSHSGLTPFEPTLPRDVDPLWTVAGNESPKPKNTRAVQDKVVRVLSFPSLSPQIDLLKTYTALNFRLEKKSLL